MSTRSLRLLFWQPAAETTRATPASFCQLRLGTFSQPKQRTASSRRPVSVNTEYTVDITTQFSCRRAPSLLVKVGRPRAQLYEFNKALLRYPFEGRWGRRRWWWLGKGGGGILPFVLERVWQRSTRAPTPCRLHVGAAQLSPRLPCW